MESKNSFFTSYEHPDMALLPGKDHVGYVESQYKNIANSTVCALRLKCIYSLNNWLESPCNDYFYDAQTSYDSDSEDIFDDNYSSLGTKNNMNSMTNSRVVQSYFKEVNKMLQENGYTIEDENQFKEDFVYFIYRLSSVKQS